MSNNIQFGLMLFITSFVIFLISTSLFGLDQEPAKGSSEVPENLNVDITDIRLLVSITCLITSIVGGIFMYAGIKESKKIN